jgi:shikimate kinase
LEEQNQYFPLQATPIFLIGFMGSGKSIVGEALAAHLDRLFIDLYQKIIESAGRHIHTIITEDGEEEFRRRESEALGIAAQTTETVVATGGGIVLRAENRQLMHDHGITVWLDAPFDLCWHRILTDGIIRPLAPDRTSALSRFEARRHLYGEARLRIEIDDQQVYEIVEMICDRLSLLKPQ